MIDRPGVTKILLILYALGSAVLAVPLLIYGHAGDLAETTSGRILAAALLTLAAGAVAASRNPWRNRLVIKMLIGFSALAALAIVYRLVLGRHESDPAWFLLPFAVAAPALLILFFPQPPDA